MRTMLMAIKPFEDHDEWEAHRDGIAESLQPEGFLEHSLVERITISLWMLRRLEAHQFLLTRRYLRGAVQDWQVAEAYAQGTISKGIFPTPTQDDIDRAQSVRSFPPADEMALIIRYQAHHHRLYIQTLHELEAIQIRRKGGTSPLARIDITGAPGGG